MSIVGKLAVMFALWWEWCKIPNALQEHPFKLKSDSTLRVYSLDAAEITVSGYYKRFTRHYVRWWAFPKTYVIFYIHGVMADPLASDKAKEIARTPVILPRLLPWYVSDKIQLECAMLAYLDIVSSRMRENK